MQNGKENSSIIEYSDEISLLQNLEKKDLIVSKIIKIPTFLAPFIPKSGKKINTENIIELLNNLYLVIKSGLPLYHGLLDIAKESNNQRYKNMIEKIAYDIYEGKSLSSAFEPYKSIITPMVLNLIRIGEETGQLEITLQRGSDFLQKIHSLKKKMKSALIYPSFAFFAVLGAMLVWMIYVLPQMVGLFKDMNIKLPPITIAVMNMSDFLSQYIIYIILAFILLIAYGRFLYKKYNKIKLFVDDALLKIPVIKSVISNFNMAFISEYLKLSLSSGIPLLDSIETIKKNLTNEIYKRALDKVYDDISSGLQLSEAFDNTKIFTPFIIRMLRSGESSGNLEEQFDYISNHYYEKVDYFAQNIGKIIEPVVLILVGGFMALIIVALMGPMYDLISNVQ
ncbi:MAG: type II secretion system F family protein [Epsilonproteobacteria bacterium]|nr:type II secretion system F family protein [Campylobacterota bacterium]